MTMIAAMSGRVSSPAFVGRAAELDGLARALEAASTSRAATCLIAGEAGIGKTRLVDEFGNRARAAGAQVLVGGCLQLGETGLPYAPFVAALRPLLQALDSDDLDQLLGPGRAELAQLLPDIGTKHRRERADASLDPSPARARLFEVVLSFLRRLGGEHPVVLVLEDIHWADASTRDLMRFLIHNGRYARFLLVATYRSDELHRRHALRPLVAELSRLDAVDSIELRAFDADELAEQLAGITGGDVSRDLVHTVLDRSGGNPFFVEELLAAGEAGLALPRSLRDTLDDRVRHLGEDARHVLRVASVAGERVDHRLMAAVLVLPDDRLNEAIREAVEHHLLIPTSPTEAPGYAFRHALVREVVYDDLLPSERTHLHAAYAQAIEAHPEVRLDGASGNAGLLAHHWFMAHDLERALPASLAAGRAAAASFAFAEAQAYLERALELWPKVAPTALPADAERTVILEEAAEAAAQAGDAHRSIDLVRAALADTDVLTDPMRAGVLHHRLTWYLNEAGDWEAGAAALERAVELIPIDPPTPERARVLSDLAHSLMVRSRFSDSLALAEAALAISRVVGAEVAEARALSALGIALACRSDFERAIPIMRDGHLRSIRLGDPLAIFLTGVALGWSYDETARHAQAYELALETRDRLRVLGAEPRFGGQLASKAARALYDLGRWDEADRLIQETIEAGTTRYALRWLLSNRLRLRAARGDLEGARSDLSMYGSLGERIVSPDPDLLNARQAELAIVAGDPRRARALVAQTLERLPEPELDSDGRLLFVIGLRAEANEADAARAAGDRGREAEAIEHGTELEERLRRHVKRVFETAAEPARILSADRTLGIALMGRIVGRDDPDVWEAAVAERRPLGRPFELAGVLAQSANAHLAARRRDEGAAALAEAHAMAVELGAVPLRERLEALARRARIGLEGVPTAEDTADRLGLTRREREVLRLLASGRSNRQIGEQLFMAESTAGVHVSNILSKLGVTRRHEAAAVAQRMGIGTS